MPTKPKTAKPAAASQRSAPKAPHVTKQQQVIEMLRRPEGATVDEITQVTGWQAHTIRGLISGLRKGKLGKRKIETVAIETVRDEGGTSYRAAPETA